MQMYLIQSTDEGETLTTLARADSATEAAAMAHEAWREAGEREVTDEAVWVVPPAAGPRGIVRHGWEE